MKPANLFETHATLKVIGVGGAGGNAVNRMIAEGLIGVDFIAANTDEQVLSANLASLKVRLGSSTTRGLGSGGDPSVGETAAKESEKAIGEAIEGADMLFIAAGMGGGTGTGAAPIVAQVAKRMGILTVAVVSKPFPFEGPKRKRLAEEGLARLREHVDTLIVVPNAKLLEIADKKTTMQEAFAMADDILRQGVQGVSDIILMPGLINVDFADVAAVMRGAGDALIGVGHASGEQRARLAAQQAATSPLLETGIRGAQRMLVNITTGPDFSLGEIQEVMEYLLQFADADDSAITMGHCLREGGDPGEVSVTVLAAGVTHAPGIKADTQVFTEGERRRDRNAPTMIQPEELDLDIPAFLRKQKLG